jgi:phage-related protein
LTSICQIKNNPVVGDVPKIRALAWVGSSRKDLKQFPPEVRSVMGYALYQAQLGLKATSARPLAGFGGASVLEIVDDFQTDTYRAAYTVRFADVVYVLHAFQKKSKKRIATPKADLDLIKRRLRAAEEDHRTRSSGKRVHN